MSTYHSFSPRAAASRVRAETKAKARERQRREEQSIWDELIAEQLTHDRQRPAQRSGKRNKAAKPQRSAEDWLREYGQALQQVAKDLVKQFQRPPPKTHEQRYDAWLQLLANAWMNGIDRGRCAANKLLLTLITHVLRAFLKQQGIVNVRDLSSDGREALFRLLRQFDQFAIANNQLVTAAAYRTLKRLDKSDRRDIIAWIKSSEDEGKSALHVVRDGREHMRNLRSVEEWCASYDEKLRAFDQQTGGRHSITSQNIYVEKTAFP